MLARHFLAEALELADLVTEIGQYFKIMLIEG